MDEDSLLMISKVISKESKKVREIKIDYACALTKVVNTCLSRLFTCQGK